MLQTSSFSLPRMSNPSRFMQIVCLLLMLLGVSSSPAFPHASLISSTPSDGETVSVHPVLAILQFNEPVSVTSISVIASDGVQHSLQADTHQDRITVTLPSQLPAGSQVISYRVISADGHPVSGSIVYSLGAATQSNGVTVSTFVVTSGIWLARWGLYIGLLGAVGGAFFVNWIAPAPAWTISWLRAAAALGVVSAALSVGLQGLDMLGAPLSTLLSVRAWAEGWRSSLGTSALVVALACVGAFLSLRSSPKILTRSLSIVALAAVGTAFSLTGHASSAEPQWLMRTAIILHGAVAAVWVGGLLPLAAAVRAAPTQSLPAVLRFSAVATLAVAALAATGAILSIIQIETWSALLLTDYGRLWIAKLSVVLMMLGLAALNRFVLTPAMAAGPQAGNRLVRSIGVESVLALLLLAVVTGWRFTPPPRATSTTPVSAIHLHMHGIKAWAHVGLSPSRAGLVNLSAMILSATSHPIDAKEVVFLFSNLMAGIEPFQRKAVKTPDGDWVVTMIPLTTAGLWTVHAEVLISDFEKELMEAQLKILP